MTQDAEAEPVAPEQSRELGTMTERFDLMSFTDALIGDLQALRKGEISIQDARARADLAKQTLRSVSYVITAQKMLMDRAAKQGRIGNG